MDGIESGEVAAEFKDRKTGLVLFGILVILIGGGCLLMVPLMMLSLAVTRSAPADVVGADTASVVIAGLFYAALGIWFVWLGVGSIMARRWARALLLVTSWLWLCLGVLGISVMIVTLPATLAQPAAGTEELPRAALTFIMIFTLAFMSVIFVLLPGVLVLFYRSRQVKATCEARDRLPRWTDACPLPVLGLSMLMAYGGLGIIFIPIAYDPVFPLLGVLLTGAPATMLWVVLIVVWLYVAWGLYRLKLEAWWTAVVVLAFQAISTVITFSRVDPMEMMRQMGYPEEQLEMVQQMGFFQGGFFWLTTLGALAVYLGYLAYLKRFFGKPGTMSSGIPK